MNFIFKLFAPLQRLIPNWLERRVQQALRQHQQNQRALGIWPSVSCSELPETMAPQTIYLWGEGGHIWQVLMLCPCGCDATLHMTTLTDDWPHWKVETNEKGDVSLRPSVWRKIGCRSHFWVRDGKIEWC